MNYLEPWEAITEHGESLIQELARETTYGHVLHAVKTQALARRIDCDDVLFSVLDSSNRVAVVHLTWKPETTPDWPAVELFDSISEWKQVCMIPEHEAWQGMVSTT